jgi:hypothetical protein
MRMTEENDKIKLEFKAEEAEVKVDMDFIKKVRAEAERQKVQRNAKQFAKKLGNNGKDMPKVEIESKTEMDDLIESMDIIEED